MVGLLSATIILTYDSIFQNSKNHLLIGRCRFAVIASVENQPTRRQMVRFNGKIVSLMRIKVTD